MGYVLEGLGTFHIVTGISTTIGGGGLAAGSGGLLAIPGAAISATGLTLAGIGTLEAMAGSKILTNCNKLGKINLPDSKLKKNLTNEELLEAGRVHDRKGYSRAGRALQKHGSRPRSPFKEPSGPPNQINKLGEEQLREIIYDPNRNIINKKNGFDIYSKNKKGARFKKNGSFIGFLDY